MCIKIYKLKETPEPEGPRGYEIIKPEAIKLLNMLFSFSNSRATCSPIYYKFPTT